MWFVAYWKFSLHNAMQLGGSYTFGKHQVRYLTSYTNLTLTILVSCPDTRTCAKTVRGSEQHILSNRAGLLLYLRVTCKHAPHSKVHGRTLIPSVLLPGQVWGMYTWLVCWYNSPRTACMYSSIPVTLYLAKLVMQPVNSAEPGWLHDVNLVQ